MKNILLAVFLFSSLFATAQNVGIGTTTPHASAKLEIKDSTRGILIPRMRMSQRLAIATPADGLMVYQNDSTKGIWFYQSNKWTYSGLPAGTTKNQILFWNDTSWVTLMPVNNSQALVICDGKLTWGGCLPKVTTSAAQTDFYSGLADTTLIAGCVLNSSGGSYIFEKGVCYGTSANPTIDNASKKVVDASNYTTLGELIPGTTYHVRAYAINESGVGYGNDTTIKTTYSQSSATNAITDIGKEMFAFSPSGSGRHDDYGQKSIDLMMDLMANDMIIHSQGYGWYNYVYQYVSWQQTTNGAIPYNTWYYYYDIIKKANHAYAMADYIQGGDRSEIEKIKGEALGYRAYAYYYLINLFQQTYKGNETKPGVPIYLSDTASGHGRGTVQQVYTQIISDLTKAELLLDGKLRTDKTEINVDVVRGFRARVALLMEDWATAATYAQLAYSTGGYTLMQGADYNTVTAFSSIDNPEWMWGSKITDVDATYYASFFSHVDINTGGYASLGGQKKITKVLYDQINAADVRKNCWTTPGTWASNGSDPNDPNVDYNQVKHQIPDPSTWAADYLYMRASEMYLIQAEALARQGNYTSARSVMQSLIASSGRYPGYNINSLTGTALINEILKQRRIELWGEGFALFDVKRLKQGLYRPSNTQLGTSANHGAPNYDPVVYTTSLAEPGFLMKIPQSEIDANPAIDSAEQNPNTTIINSNSSVSVSTNYPNSISSNSAVSGGTISVTGSETIIGRGVVWDVATNPTTALSTKTNDGIGVGTFTSNLTGLLPTTKYYVRAYAIGNMGTTYYGAQVSFYTDCYINNLNDFIGGYTSVNESIYDSTGLTFLSSYSYPNPTSILSTNNLTSTTANATITNVHDYGWPPITVKFDWTNPLNKTTEVIAQNGITDRFGDTYEIRPYPNNEKGSFTCNAGNRNIKRVTLLLQVRKNGGDWFDYIVTMQR